LRADTGIYLFPEHRDKGLGTLALEAAKDYSRHRLGLHQLTASVSESNPKALGCYRKAGFTSTGRRRDWLRMAEGWEDVELLWCCL
ncbi:MAG: GNAT family N-acetyltransferase, partial [Muribaculaceae bacterium]|nr:GNAT family N-acetyltransferase [Muribaculaceae bacterium]